MNMTNKIEFTDSAKKEIERIVLEKGEKTYFRISVQGGGCSGFKYNFSFDDKVKPNDEIFNKTIVDRNSLKIIDGSIVDFKKELIGNSFVVNNPKGTPSNKQFIKWSLAPKSPLNIA